MCLTVIRALRLTLPAFCAGLLIAGSAPAVADEPLTVPELMNRREQERNAEEARKLAAAKKHAEDSRKKKEAEDQRRAKIAGKKAEATHNKAGVDEKAKEEAKHPTDNTQYHPGHISGFGKNDYPSEAKANGREGTVSLKVHILADGEIGEVTVINSSGHGILDEAAVDMVKDGHATPAHQGDKPVDSWVIVPYRFHLEHTENETPTTLTIKPFDLGIEMVRIPAGEFWMGSDISDTDVEGDENPKYKVNVQAFSIGKYEVTRGQYAAFVKDTGYDFASCYHYSISGSFVEQFGVDWRKPGFAQNDNHPAVCVSLNDALAFIQWINRKTGQVYRLPTEAEWEYAARAGTDTIRYWGDDPNEACRYENIGDQTGRLLAINWSPSQPIHDCTDGYAYTAPVGHYAHNGFNLYDMLGNVSEWTCSAYEYKYSGSERTCLGNKAANYNQWVYRGGNWASTPAQSRSANRFHSNREYGGYVGLGFRLARDF